MADQRSQIQEGKQKVPGSLKSSKPRRQIKPKHLKLDVKCPAKSQKVSEAMIRVSNNRLILISLKSKDPLKISIDHSFEVFLLKLLDRV